MSVSGTVGSGVTVVDALLDAEPVEEGVVGVAVGGAVADAVGGSDDVSGGAWRLRLCASLAATRRNSDREERTANFMAGTVTRRGGEKGVVVGGEKMGGVC